MEVRSKSARPAGIRREDEEEEAEEEEEDGGGIGRGRGSRGKVRYSTVGRAEQQRTEGVGVVESSDSARGRGRWSMVPHAESYW